MSEICAFYDGFILSDEAIDKAVHAVLEAMKNELPTEAHRLDVLYYVLEEAKEQIDSLQIVL